MFAFFIKTKNICKNICSTLAFFSFCRLLQISSFNGKMNALNEVNKVISSVSYYTHRHNPEEEEWLTAERMAVSEGSGRNSSWLSARCAQIPLVSVCPACRSGSSRTKSCPSCCGTVFTSRSTWRSWRRSFVLSSRKKHLRCRIWTTFGLLR